MSNYSDAEVNSRDHINDTGLFVRAGHLAGVAAVLMVLLVGLAGCRTPQPASVQPADIPKSDVVVLHEGDSLRISFPGAPNLNMVQQIRRDGRISLPLVGEFKAAGLTPAEMEKELIKLYGSQLQTKEVNIILESSSYAVYVTGAVLRPGKITSDRPITALEAIMEAGGFDYTKANLKNVRVIRNENGLTQHQTLNLKSVLKGDENDQFKLKPSDIIYVPERFTWF